MLKASAKTFVLMIALNAFGNANAASYLRSGAGNPMVAGCQYDFPTTDDCGVATNTLPPLVFGESCKADRTVLYERIGKNGCSQYGSSLVGVDCRWACYETNKTKGTCKLLREHCKDNPALDVFTQASALCECGAAVVCGDGTKDGGKLITEGGSNFWGEECDDGNTVNNDGCSSDCKVEKCADTGQTQNCCGDGTQGPFEECDRGASNGTLPALCNTDCTLNLDYICGNNKCEGNESRKKSDGTLNCPEDCGGCGDGVCDTSIGSKEDPVTCPSDCKCGNGVTEDGEQCDDGNAFPNDGCLNDCTLDFPVCGDSVQSPSEECDDGNITNGDGCSADCRIEGCGDSTVGANEECDDGNLNNADGCSSSCTIEGRICGDGLGYSGEQCDDGNNFDGDGCSSTCVTEFCGDGIKQANEGCDDGNIATNDGCDNSCVAEVCGDGIVNNGTETCDDGNTTSNDWCSSTCKIESCGDGILQGWIEGCDDGNNTPGDGCNATCSVEVCGNGFVDAGEQCDDSNASSNDGCSSSCQTEVCGDGIKQMMEGCDDGNTANNDGCTSACVTEFCGDGIVQTGEQCDEGNYTTGTHCNTSCTIDPWCGDGMVNGSDACDDGNNFDGDGCSASCQNE